MMTCDLDGLLTNGAKRDYEFPLKQLADHLRELRDRTRAGDMAAVEEFFSIYTFSDRDE